MGAADRDVSLSVLEPRLDDLHVLPLPAEELAFVVELAEEPPQPALELVDAHVLRPIVHVEQRAAVPVPFLEQAAFAAQPVVERRVRERASGR